RCRKISKPTATVSTRSTSSFSDLNLRNAYGRGLKFYRRLQLRIGTIADKREVPSFGLQREDKQMFHGHEKDLKIQWLRVAQAEVTAELTLHTHHNHHARPRHMWRCRSRRTSCPRLA